MAMCMPPVKFTLRQPGAISIKGGNVKTLLLWLIFLPFTAGAINVGTMTFAMDQDQSFVAKRVLNNNASARFYQVSIRAIDWPGEQEVRTRPAEGELLFAPKQLTLRAGQGNITSSITMGRRIIKNVIIVSHFARYRLTC